MPSPAPTAAAGMRAAVRAARPAARASPAAIASGADLRTAPASLTRSPGLSTNLESRPAVPATYLRS